jgi:hypothetical protein
MQTAPLAALKRRAFRACTLVFPLFVSSRIADPQLRKSSALSYI